MALIKHIRALNQAMVNRPRWFLIIVLCLVLILIGFVFSRYWLIKFPLAITKAPPIVSPSATASASASVLSIPDHSGTAKTLSYLEPLAYHVAITPKSSRAKAVIQAQRPRLAKAFSDKRLRLGSPIFIRIFKATKELEIWVKEDNKPTFAHFKTYPIATYSGQLGPKTAEGDRQAPEGFYFVAPGALNPHSRFHLSFNLGYPNVYDRKHQYTGSALMVHGNRVSIGCYAMTDALIEEIYTIADAALSAEQAFFRVHSFPFRMTAKNLQQYAASPHADFWDNLREGYEIFEKTHIPPNVDVENRRYVFNR